LNILKTYTLVAASIPIKIENLSLNIVIMKIDN